MSNLEKVITKLLILYTLVIWSCIAILLPFKWVGVSDNTMTGIFYVAVLVMSVYFSYTDAPSEIYNWIEARERSD